MRPKLVRQESRSTLFRLSPLSEHHLTVSREDSGQIARSLTLVWSGYRTRGVSRPARRSASRADSVVNRQYDLVPRRKVTWRILPKALVLDSPSGTSHRRRKRRLIRRIPLSGQATCHSNILCLKLTVARENSAASMVSRPPDTFMAIWNSSPNRCESRASNCGSERSVSNPCSRRVAPAC